MTKNNCGLFEHEFEDGRCLDCGITPEDWYKQGQLSVLKELMEEITVKWHEEGMTYEDFKDLLLAKIKELEK